MDNDKRFYIKMSLVIAAAFFIWFFGSSEKKENVSENGEKIPVKDKPAALENFVPPTLVVFKDSENVLPKRNWSTPPLELQAGAAIAVKLDGSRVYYNKNMNERRPIASLTKLMTAIIVLENFNLYDIIKISKNDVKRIGSSGDLRPDESLTARSLLNIMLIDSSNDAALALSRQKPNFISLMNKKAKELGLSDTHFVNPDGIDEDGSYSSASDVAKIFSNLAVNYPQVLEVLETKNMVIYSSDGKFEHRLKNTNELLNLVADVKAGKTGYTDKAGGSLALLVSNFKQNNDKNDIITVVLGSLDRFGESEKLIQWLKEAYIWGN